MEECGGSIPCYLSIKRFAMKSFFSFYRKSTNPFPEILDGGVQIINNRYLRYGPWVYWQDIIRNSDAPIEIQFNGARGQRRKISLPFPSCLTPPFFFTLLSFSQAGVTSLVGTTAGAQTRTSVRSVSFPVSPVPFPSSSRRESTTRQHDAHANSHPCSPLFASLPQ